MCGQKEAADNRGGVLRCPCDGEDAPRPDSSRALEILPLLTCGQPLRTRPPPPWASRVCPSVRVRTEGAPQSLDLPGGSQADVRGGVRVAAILGCGAPRSPRGSRPSRHRAWGAPCTELSQGPPASERGLPCPRPRGGSGWTLGLTARPEPLGPRAGARWAGPVWPPLFGGNGDWGCRGRVPALLTGVTSHLDT